jgi:hypothetical protein
MGLNTTHNAWHGPYSSFMTWRTELSKIYNIPLELMEGFYYKGDVCSDPFLLLHHKFKNDELEIKYINRLEERLPLKWENLKKNPIYILLRHSDCDGYISYGNCGKIANELKNVIEKIEPDDNIYSFYNRTKQFMEGCILAYKNKEKLKFH